MTRTVIAHLSDPHFGTVPPEVKDALLGRLRELWPQLVLISGDITQRARRAQFQEAAAFVRALAPTPVFCVPGNHDIPLINLPLRLLHPYFGFGRYLQGRRETYLRVGSAEVFGLNSTSRWRHVQGFLDTERVTPKLSRERAASVRIAMVHHPLACAKAIDDKNRLSNRDDVLTVFGEAGVDLVLSGHVHDPFVSLLGPLVVSVAGTCLSWRTRKGAPNSFHLIEIDAGDENEPRLTITRNNFSAESGFQDRFPPLMFVRRNGTWSATETRQ